MEDRQCGFGDTNAEFELGMPIWQTSPQPLASSDFFEKYYRIIIRSLQVAVLQCRESSQAKCWPANHGPESPRNSNPNLVLVSRMCVHDCAM